MTVSLCVPLRFWELRGRCRVSLWRRRDQQTQCRCCVERNFLNISQEMVRTVRCPLCTAEAEEKCLGTSGNHRERANYFKELAMGKVLRLPDA